MKSLFGKYVWLQLVLSILLLFGGTLIVVFASSENNNFLPDALNIVAAVILFLFGLFSIVAAFVFETKKVFTNGLLYGSASIAFGVFLLLKEIILLEYLVLLLAIFFIVIGAVFLIKAVIFTIFDRKKVLEMVVSYIVASIFIAGGILALIFQDDVSQAFCIIAGALLIAGGIYELVIGIISMIGQVKKRPLAPIKKNGKNDNKENVVNTQKKQDVVVEEKKEDKTIKELDYTDETKVVDPKKPVK